MRGLSEDPSDLQMIVALWDCSTCKPTHTTPRQISNLRPFAEWGNAEFGQAELCRAMEWSTSDYDRLTTDVFEESTGRLKHPGARRRGKASDQQRQWNEWGGALGPGANVYRSE